MSDTATKPAQAQPTPKQQAIKAWFECKDDAERKACVTQYPILAEIYTLAATLK